MAVFNSNDELATMLRESLTSSGLLPIVALLSDLKRGRLDWRVFLNKYEPEVVIFDVAAPFRPNWTYLALIRNSDVAKHVPFVLTTPNRLALERQVGWTGAIELTGSLPELQAIVRAACTAIAGTRVKATDRLSALSERERLLLTLLAEGLSNLEIAGRVGLSQHTIRTYLTGVFRKLHVGNRCEAAALLVRTSSM